MPQVEGRSPRSNHALTCTVTVCRLSRGGEFRHQLTHRSEQSAMASALADLKRSGTERRRVITEHRKLNGSHCHDGAGTRVERARRPRYSSESVMDMSTARRRASCLHKGGSGRCLALEPTPRTARCGIDERARSPCRLLEQSTKPAHGFHPVQSIRDCDTIEPIEGYLLSTTGHNS